MESKRQQKMASLLQQELAEVLRRDLPHVLGGGLVPSISAIHLSPDLGVARVYLSLLPGQEASARLAQIQEHTKDIRYALGRRIRNHVRVVPELTFFHDDSAAYAAHIDKVLGALHIPPAPPAEADDDDEASPRLFNPKTDD